MGMTLTEKILARHSGQETVKPGDIAMCRVDLVMINDLMGPVCARVMREMGAERVFDPDKIACVPSHMIPARDIVSADLANQLQRFAREQGIPHYWEVGRSGIEHALLPDEGYIAPGELIVGADSHSCTYGACGAFSTGMGITDVAAAMALGETWLRVPSTLRFEFTGPLRPFVTGKDLMLHLIGTIGVDGARYRAMEFVGDTIRGLDMQNRLILCNMAIEAGGKNGVVPADEVTHEYLRTRVKRPYVAVQSDPDAEFERTYTFDTSQIPLTIACPSSPANTKPIDAVEGVKITQAFIGSCTNARLEDLHQAASVLRGRTVHPDARLIVTPATSAIYRRALQDGTLGVLAEAGAAITAPGCGACAGLGMGVLGAEDVCISTTNRNFRGRMGHRDAQVYLSNAYVVAASAIAGEIINPARVAEQVTA